MLTSERRALSLRTCHMPAERPPLQPVRETAAYIPELSETLERDINLCDGARRCARIAAGYVYRRRRESRCATVTVSYLARALRRSHRTVQRYLRQLEAAGYLRAEIVASPRSRLCVGLAITLLRPLFARHHAQKWPVELRIPATTPLTDKQSSRVKTLRISLVQWQIRCTEPIHRSYMKTLPAFTPFP